jgi:hypothetical protein
MSAINASTAGLMVTDAIAATEPGIAADGSLVPGRPAVPGGLTMGVYARGTDPNNRSIWHEAFSGVTVIESPSLSLDDVPSHVMPSITLERALHPRTGKPLPGLSLILADGVSTPLGFAGGRKRLNWTGVQPSQIFDAALKIKGAGGSVESAFMLADGRFVVEGTLPLDAQSENRLGADRHYLRFCYIGNYSGAGRDLVLVTIVRGVCWNMVAVATLDAKKHGDIMRIGHNSKVERAWTVDLDAFIGHYSPMVAEHVSKVAALNERAMAENERDAYFRAVLGDEPETGKGATFYRWRLEALRKAAKAENENAQRVGIPTDTRRVAYEAVTNVLNHGGIVRKGEANDPTADAWYDGLNGARNEAGRVSKVLASPLPARALALALA